MEEEKFRLKVEKKDREYILECSSRSPLGELYDVLTEMRSFVINRILEEHNGKELQEEKKEE